MLETTNNRKKTVTRVRKTVQKDESKSDKKAAVATPIKASKVVSYVEAGSNKARRTKAVLKGLMLLLSLVVIALIGWGVHNSLQNRRESTETTVVNNPTIKGNPNGMHLQPTLTGNLMASSVVTGTDIVSNGGAENEDTETAVETMPIAQEGSGAEAMLQEAIANSNSMSNNVGESLLEKIALLEKQVTYLSQEMDKTRDGQRGTIMVLALLDLEQKVAAGEDFAQEVNILKELLVGGSRNIDRKLAKFSEYAKNGLMSEYALSDTFNDTIAREIKIFRDGKKSGTLVDNMRNNAMRLFTIRSIKETNEYLEDKIGEASTDHLLLTVDRYLRERRYNQAINLLETELDKVSQPLPANIRKWLDEVSMHAEVNEFVETSVRNLKKVMRNNNR